LKRAVFFDRDGVLNQLVIREGGYFSPQSFDQFKIVDTAEFVINKLREKGFLSIVASNQPDITRNNLKKSELDKMTKVLINELLVDDVFYCTHDSINHCECRKPLPGLLIQAAKKWKIDLQKSYMVGDTWKDAEAAKNAKVNFMLLNRNYNLDYYCSKRIDSLSDILKFIKG